MADLKYIGKNILNHDLILKKGDISGSLASTGSFGNLKISDNASVTGDMVVGGTLTAQEIHTEIESASIIFSSGSTLFGNTQDDIHTFTGSLKVTGSLTTIGNISGSAQSTGSFGHLNIAGPGDNVANFQAGNRTLSLKLNDSAPSGDVGVQFRAGGGDYLGLAAGGGTAHGIVIHSNNRVAIGHDNPTVKLDVFGGIKASGDITANGNIVGDNSTNISAVNDIIALGDISGSAQSTGSFGHISTDTITSFRINGSPTFTGDSTGFGIGVNDPGFGLDVASSGRFTGTLTLGQASSTDGTIVLHNSTGAATFTIQNEDGNGVFQASSDSNRTLTFKNTGAGDKLSVLVEGDVSGSSTSTGSFGRLMLGGQTIKSTTEGIAIVNDSEAYTLLSPPAAFQVVSEVDNQWFAYFRNNESTAGRNYGLYVRAGTNSTDSPFKIADKDDSTILRVSGEGTLGINTNSPQSGQKLHVVGDSFFTGNVSGSSTSTGSFGQLNIKQQKIYEKSNDLVLESTPDHIVFRTGANDRAALDKNGSFIIGTGANVPATNHTGGGGSLTVYNNGTSIIKIANSTTGQDANSGTDLQITGGTSEFLILNRDATDIKLKSNSNEFRLDASANAWSGSSTSLGSFGSVFAATHITASGNLEVAGNISGSATSTGSFGRVELGHSNSAPMAVYGNVATAGIRLQNYKGYFEVDPHTSTVNITSDKDEIQFQKRIGARYGITGYSTGDLVFFTNSGNTTHATFSHFNGTSFTQNITGSGNLEIAGNISGSATSTGSFGHLNIAGPGGNVANFQAGNRTLSLKLNDSAPSGDVGVQFRAGGGDYLGLAAGGGTAHGIVIHSNNRVAIGHDNPTVKLDVFGGIKASGDITANGNIVGDNSTNISAVNDIIALGDISGSAQSTGSFGHISTDTITSFRINGSPTFTGDSTGFGIGVNDPGFGLDVASSGRFTGTLTLGQASSTDGTIVLHNSTGAATFTIQNEDGNGVFQASSDSNRTLTFKNTGAGDKLSVLVEGDVSGSSTSTGSFGKLEVGSQIRLIEGGDSFIKGGDLGIGTNTPVARLEIEDDNTTNAMLLKLTQDNNSVYGMVIGNDTFSTNDTQGGQHILGNDGTYIIRSLGTSTAARIGAGTAFNNYKYLEIDFDTDTAEFTTTNISGSATSTGSFGLILQNGSELSTFLGDRGTETLFSGSVVSTGSFGRLDIVDNVSATSFTGIFQGALSGSAQIASNISGAFAVASASFAANILSNSSSFAARDTLSEATSSKILNGELEFTNITGSGHISMSLSSTGSFGRVSATTIGGHSPLVVDSNTTFTNSITSSAHVSSSMTSTASFGRVNVVALGGHQSLTIDPITTFTNVITASNKVQFDDKIFIETGSIEGDLHIRTNENLMRFGKSTNQLVVSASISASRFATGSDGSIIDLGFTAVDEEGNVVLTGEGDGIHVDSNNYWYNNKFYRVGNGRNDFLVYDDKTIKYSGEVVAQTGSFAGEMYINSPTGSMFIGKFTGGIPNSGSDNTSRFATGSDGSIIDLGFTTTDEDGNVILTTTGDGLHVDDRNYWYTTGHFKIGNANNFINWNTSNLTVSGTFIGDGSGLTGVSSFDGSAGTENLFSGSASSTGSFGIIENNTQIAGFRPIVNQTTDFSASLSNAGRYHIVHGNLTCSIGTDANMPVTIGAEYEFFQSSSVGKFLFQTGSGVSLLSKNDNRNIAGQHSGATLKKVAANTFHLVGDLT